MEIGNGSSGTTTPVVGNATLADAISGGTGGSDDNVGSCSTGTGTSGDGEGTPFGGDMARKNVTATFDTVLGARIITLDTASANDAFTFDVSNATTVTDSGLFNADYQTTENDRTCPGSGGTAGTHWNMFSRQLLDQGNGGITVTDGDSLSVKWTITIN